MLRRRVPPAPRGCSARTLCLERCMQQPSRHELCTCCWIRNGQRAAHDDTGQRKRCSTRRHSCRTWVAKRITESCAGELRHLAKGVTIRRGPSGPTSISLQKYSRCLVPTDSVRLAASGHRSVDDHLNLSAASSAVKAWQLDQAHAQIKEKIGLHSHTHGAKRRRKNNSGARETSNAGLPIYGCNLPCGDPACLQF